MKSQLAVLLVLVLTAFLIWGCSEQQVNAPNDTNAGTSGTIQLSHTAEEPFVTELYAGQTIDVGEVQVWNDGTNLYVTYKVDLTDWCLTETHLHVATTLEGIPQTKNGNPIPGQFDYKHEDLNCVTEDSYTIPLTDIDPALNCDDEVYIAAHAVVANYNECAGDAAEEIYLADCGNPSDDGQGTELYTIEFDDGNQVANLTHLVSLTPATTYDQVAAIAASLDGTKIYVIDKASKHLGIYDFGSNAFTDYVAIPGLPDGVVQAAFSPDGKLYVSSDNVGDLRVIDLSDPYNPYVSQIIDLGNFKMQGADIIFAANGTLYLFTNASGIRGLYKIDDLTATQPIAPVYVGTPASPYFTGLAIREAGTGDIVGSAVGSPIYIVDPMDGSVITTYATFIDGNPYPVGYGDMTVGTLCEVPRTETAWGAGNDFPGNNWATYFNYTIQCEEPPPPPTGCETAFAYGEDDATCFIGSPWIITNRWGWTNGSLGTGTYEYDIYAGAGQCDLSKGTLVGKLTIVYDGSTATVTYTMNSPYVLDETHLYVGNEPLPRDVNNNYTVAPGQYPYQHDLAGTDSDSYSVAATGNIYVVAHAVVCGFEE